MPLAFLDMVGSMWRVLFIVVVAVLPPGLAGGAPWVWGALAAVGLGGLAAGLSGAGTAEPSRPRPAWRRRALRCGQAALSLWLALCLAAAFTDAAVTARERRAWEEAAFDQAINGLPEALVALGQAIEAARQETGRYPALDGAIDWVALRQGSSRDLRLVTSEDGRRFVVDVTPRATPLPWDVGLWAWAGNSLAQLLELARRGWPSNLEPVSVYFEWATPQEFSVVVLPSSDRSRARLNDTGWVLDGRGVRPLFLAEALPTLERMAADHAALALESAGRRLSDALADYRRATGVYPLDARGLPDWTDLHYRGLLTLDETARFRAALAHVRFALVSPLACPPYIGSVVYLGSEGPDADVAHAYRVTRDTFRFTFSPRAPALRKAMESRARMMGCRGADLVVTPEGVRYEPSASSP